jgi:hypothetical protein
MNRKKQGEGDFMKCYFGKKLIAARGYLSDKQWRNSRIVVFAKASVITNAIIALGKIGMSIHSLSFFLFVNGLFNVGIGIAKAIAVKGHHESEKESEKKCGARGGNAPLFPCVSCCADSEYRIYGVQLSDDERREQQYKIRHHYRHCDCDLFLC